MYLILSENKIIDATENIITHDLGYEAVHEDGSVMYPFTSGVTGFIETEIPPEFDLRYCVMEGTNIVCTIPSVNPEPKIKQKNVSKLTFLKILAIALGENRAAAILTNGKFLLIYAGANQIDYTDVFIGIDNNPEDPSYTAQLLYINAVSQEEITTLESLWPDE